MFKSVKSISLRISRPVFDVSYDKIVGAVFFVKNKKQTLREIHHNTVNFQNNFLHPSVDPEYFKMGTVV